MSVNPLDFFLEAFIPGYGLLKKEAEKAAPGKTISPGTALVTGDVANTIVDKPSGAGEVNLDFLGTLENLATTNPQGLVTAIKPLLTLAAVGAGLLSFIPTTANFGGPTAARIIDRLIDPFGNKAYKAPLEDYLDNFFPTRELSAFSLIRAIESGTVSEAEVVDELVDAGTKSRGINIALRLARFKRFEAETDDDMRTLTEYRRALTTYSIETRRDDLRESLRNLLELKRDLMRERREIERSVS